ncbi:MAG: hypothetical protein M3151_02180 [Actinomycetota bacterium]|nr:hypothetical protein [Actinomycetota bacterium]
MGIEVYAVVVFIGAALGSWFRRTGGPRLELGWALGAFANRRTGDISPLYALFEVRNAGEMGARIVRLSVELKGGTRLDLAGNLLEGELPRDLASGAAAQFRVRARALAARIRDGGQTGRPRVKLVVEDAGGSEHTKRFRFRVDEYLALKDEN